MPVDNEELRTRHILAQKEQIYSAWLDNAKLKPGPPAHVLCFDLSDSFSRQALLSICSEVANFKDLKRVLAKPQQRVQSMFASEELFLSITRRYKPDFQLKPDSFCVMYFGCGGLSVVWFPTPLATDGQHRRAT